MKRFLILVIMAYASLCLRFRISRNPHLPLKRLRPARRLLPPRRKR